MNLYCFYSKSHKLLFEKYFYPSANSQFNIIEKKSKQVCKTGLFADAGWIETQAKKVQWWISAMKQNLGKVIVCSDVDVQFFEGSKSILLSEIEDCDIAFQKNSDDKPDVCSGFFICRCSFNLIKFMELVLINLKNKTSGSGEQVEINKLLLSESKINFKWKYLDRKHFWNPGFKYESVNNLTIPKEIIFHHANWCVGIQNKITQLDFVKNKIASLKLNKYKSKNPKILICTSSLLRNFEFASISLITRIIKSLPSKPDFIGHFPSASKTYKNIITLKSLENYCNEFTVKFESEPDVSQFLDFDSNMAFQINGLKGNLLQWSSMKSCLNIVQEQSLNQNHGYDWVIWFRPDLYYFNSLDNINLLDNNNYYSASHDNHLNGLNDRFFISNFSNACKRMSIYDYFTQEWYQNFHNDQDHLTWSSYYNKYVWNPEIVLKDYLNKINLNLSKLNLCFGKLRDDLFATTPHWNIYQNEHDTINYEVLNKIKQMNIFTPNDRQYLNTVNILEDSSLLYRFNKSEPLESKVYHQPTKSNMLHWLFKKK